MMFAFFGVFIAMVFRARKLNNLVSQVLINPNGQDITFVFANQRLRKLRSDKAEVTLPITSLLDPPQGDNYKPLSGTLVPTEWPYQLP